MSRKEAREDSFKMLFEAAVVGTTADELLEKFRDTAGDGDIWEQNGIDEADFLYMSGVLHGVEDNLAEINAAIKPFLRRWTLERLAKTDLALLRLAAYEAFYMDDVPAGVAVNEAVELAKKYGGDNSPAFVNGVMHSMLREGGAQNG